MLQPPQPGDHASERGIRAERGGGGPERAYGPIHRYRRASGPLVAKRRLESRAGAAPQFTPRSAGEMNHGNDPQRGNPIHTTGNLPWRLRSEGARLSGSRAAICPDVSLKDFAGKRKILNIVEPRHRHLRGVCAALQPGSRKQQRGHPLHLQPISRSRRSDSAKPGSKGRGPERARDRISGRLRRRITDGRSRPGLLRFWPGGGGARRATP